MHIFSVNGVCGSYKTTYAAKYAADAALTLNAKIVFAQPTTDLLGKWHDHFRQNFPDVRVIRIDSTTHEHDVYGAIEKFATEQNKTDDGCILMVTHKALLELPCWANKESWHAICDEIPQVDGEYNCNVAVPESIAFLTKFFEVKECGKAKWLEIAIRDRKRAELHAWGKNEWKDSAIAVFQPLYQAVGCRDTVVHVARASWQRMLQEGKAKMFFHWYKKPDALLGWGSMTVMGANFDQSLMAKISGAQGVEFRPSKRIVPTMTAYTEQIGSRFTFHYIGERNWSKALFKRLGDSDELSDDCAKKLHPVIRDIFGDEPFGWVGNLVLSDDAIRAQFPRGERVPNFPHGRNDWRHLKKLIFFSALNNTPSHFAYLADMFGIDPNELREARSHEIAHQAFMRTDGRNADSRERIDVILPDYQLGTWAARLMPGSRLVAYDMGEPERAVVGQASRSRGRPIKTNRLTGYERVKRAREKERELMITKNTIRYNLFSYQGIHLTHEASIDSTEVVGSRHVNWDEVIDQLERMSAEFCPRKEANVLINGGNCDIGTDDGKVKGKANFSSINGIWLDIDDGELTPHELANVILPQFKLVIFNSFNNGVDGKLKYRVLIPTSRLMPSAAYEMVWDEEMIESFGYFVGFRDAYAKKARFMPNLKWSGVDRSKRAANSFYYYPCRAIKGGRHSFFHRFLDEPRAYLNPLCSISSRHSRTTTSSYRRIGTRCRLR